MGETTETNGVRTLNSRIISLEETTRKGGTRNRTAIIMKWRGHIFFGNGKCTKLDV